MCLDDKPTRIRIAAYRNRRYLGDVSLRRTTPMPGGTAHWQLTIGVGYHFQRQGVGSQLMRRAFAEVGKLGYSSIGWHVNGDSGMEPTRLMLFYQRLGAVVITPNHNPYMEIDLTVTHQHD
jgi:GNAT superfamily N-acetyltransferase